MEKIIGEMMGKGNNGLLGGKGGSMHLTDVDKGALWGSYAIIGTPSDRGGRGLEAQYLKTGQLRSASLGTAPPTLGHFMRP